MRDKLNVKGHYVVECYDRHGRLKWKDEIHNTVMTEGKNLALDAFLAGAAYTVTGPYVGLISSINYTAIAAGDTAAQINGTNGWTEAGVTNLPAYTVPRKTPVWGAAAAGVKAFSTAAAFNITNTGTLKGAFLVFGPGAVDTVDSVAGTLWSAGLFSTDHRVGNGDTVNVSYSVSL